MVEQKEPNFTLPEIQNEILKEMSWSILCDIAESIKKADIYVIIMVDKTSDVSNKEQAILCVCWVDENLFSYEDFLELHEMEKTNVISIKNVIKDIFLRLGFESEKFRDDGCATMMGNKKGLKNYLRR